MLELSQGKWLQPVHLPLGTAASLTLGGPGTWETGDPSPRRCRVLQDLCIGSGLWGLSSNLRGPLWELSGLMSHHPCHAVHDTWRVLRQNWVSFSFFLSYSESWIPSLVIRGSLTDFSADPINSSPNTTVPTIIAEAVLEIPGSGLGALQNTPHFLLTTTWWGRYELPLTEEEMGFEKVGTYPGDSAS